MLVLNGWRPDQPRFRFVHTLPPLSPCTLVSRSALLAQGYLVLYQTKLKNTSSMRLGTSLGFKKFATSMSVRMTVW